MSPHLSGRQRGVALVEALVAFAIMAFGMLAVVGMQSTLRGNADLARQRAEAVRIAQDHIEDWRGFTKLDNSTNTDRRGWNEIVSSPSGGEPVPVPDINTVFTLERTVVVEPAVTGTVAAARKSIFVDVSWTDRTGQPQFVRLSTALAAVEPELEASSTVALYPDAVLLPKGRSRAIPTPAIDIGGGKSAFVPPGQSSTDPSRVLWVFNNSTGLLQVCRTTALNNASLTAASVNLANDCSDQIALLVSGFLNFDLEVPATSFSVMHPNGFVPDFGLTILAPTAPATPTCFNDNSLSVSIAYYCAVPISISQPSWTGKVVFTSPLIAPSASTVSQSQFRVCRYPSTAESFVGQQTSVFNQNFVYISAGDDAVPYPCPSPVIAFQPEA